MKGVDLINPPTGKPPEGLGIIDFDLGEDDRSQNEFLAHIQNFLNYAMILGEFGKWKHLAPDNKLSSSPWFGGQR